MESIYVGYATSDHELGQALVSALQRTGAQVWDDSLLQHAADLDQAAVFQACHQFVLVVSHAGLQSQELRSQTLHYVTLHHRASDYQVTLVLREKLVTRDLWLFVRHFPRIEQGNLTESAVLAQVKQTFTMTPQRKPSRRLSTLIQRAGLVQGALATPPRFRRSWARTWRLQIIAATSAFLVLLAFLISSTLLVKHTIIDHQSLTSGSSAIAPTFIVLPTATSVLQPIFQATSTTLPHPSPTAHATPTPIRAATPNPTAAVLTPTPIPVAAPPNLDLLLNNTGISDDSNTAQADYDTSGYSYSEQTLQAAGLMAGAPITLNGVPFSWPKVGAGMADNVIPNGQIIPLTATLTATTVAFIGSATNGPSSGTGTLTYSDGSTQPFTLEFSDWALGGGLLADNTIIATLPYRNFNQSARQDLTVYVFYTQIALSPGKVLASVTLPANSNTGLLHIFAMGIK